MYDTTHEQTWQKSNRINHENLVPYACHYNIDTACVELLLSDATVICINTHTIESLYAQTKHHRSELDYLIYNHPMEYATLVLSGDIQFFLQGSTEHAHID